MDGPLEDRDVMFNPISPKEALVDFVKRRDEQLTRLNIIDSRSHQYLDLKQFIFI